MRHTQRMHEATIKEKAENEAGPQCGKEFRWAGSGGQGQVGLITLVARPREKTRAEAVQRLRQAPSPRAYLTTAEAVC